jgi:hypothetical protein
MVTVTVDMKDRDIALAAIQKRCTNVSKNGDTVHAHIKMPGRQSSIPFSINLKNMEVRYDSDYNKLQVQQDLQNAYEAQTLIKAAEEHNWAYTETVENGQLVIDVEVPGDDVVLG